MRETIQNFEGTDAELLAELNRPQHKRVINDGLVTLATVAAANEPLAGKLALTLKRIADGLKSQYEAAPAGDARDFAEAQYEIVRSFRLRLTESSIGAPIDSDSFRAQFTGMMTQAGWTPEEIDAVLSFGAVFESTAQLAINRDATQEDVDNERAAIARDAAFSAIAQRANAAIDAAREAVGQGLDASAVTSAGVSAWEV